MNLLKIVLLLGVCAFAQAEQASVENVDPWRGLNEATYKFNGAADKIVLKPVAQGYSKLMPNPVRAGVRNFFSNLNNLNNGLNNVLQGKPKDGLSDFVRLLVNTTIGVAGLFDPASMMGLDQHNESFGQTLTVWGVPAGPYIVVRFLGPRTLTDAVVGTVTMSFDPLSYYHPVADRNVVFALRGIDERAALLKIENLVFGDRYIFIRDAYLQRRNYLVHDGEVEDEFDDF